MSTSVVGLKESIGRILQKFRELRNEIDVCRDLATEKGHFSRSHDLMKLLQFFDFILSEGLHLDPNNRCYEWLHADYYEHINSVVEDIAQMLIDQEVDPNHADDYVRERIDEDATTSWYVSNNHGIKIVFLCGNTDLYGESQNYLDIVANAYREDVEEAANHFFNHSPQEWLEEQLEELLEQGDEE